MQGELVKPATEAMHELLGAEIPEYVTKVSKFTLPCGMLYKQVQLQFFCIKMLFDVPTCTDITHTLT